MIRTAFVFIFVLAVTGLSLSANASIINGSFELAASGTPPSDPYTKLTVGSTAIAGWTIAAGSVDWIYTHWDAADGDRSLDLVGTEDGSVSTTTSFDTVVGQTYRLGFAMAGNPGGGGMRDMVVSVDSVDSGGTVLGNLAQETFTFDTSGKTERNMGWEYHSLFFTADAAKAKLTFANGNVYATNAGAALDDVSVTAIPEPATLLIWSLVGGLVIATWRRR